MSRPGYPLAGEPSSSLARSQPARRDGWAKARHETHPGFSGARGAALSWTGRCHESWLALLAREAPALACSSTAPRWPLPPVGIDPGTDPTAAIMMRGAGARDCFTGSALLYSAVRGGDYRPWLAVRAVADGLAGVLSLREGTRFSRQAKTTRSAFLLAGAELVLWLCPASHLARG
jgi:hypothetical protein